MSSEISSMTLTKTQLGKMLEQHLNENILSVTIVVTNIKVINGLSGSQNFEIEFEQEGQNG